MQLFVSIKGLFEAGSRVAIQANVSLNQISGVLKSRLWWAFALLTLPILTLGQNNSRLELHQSLLNQGKFVSPKSGKTNLKTANRLISNNTANVVISPISTTITTLAPTSVLVNYLYDYIPAASNATDLVGITSTGIIPSWLNFTPSGNSTRNTIQTNISNFHPSAITQDINGNVYVAENYPTSGNLIKIRKITPNGTVLDFCTIPNDPIFYDAYSYGGLIIVGNYLYVGLYNFNYSNTINRNGGIVRFNLADTNPAGQVIINDKSIMGLAYYDGALYASSFSSGEILKIEVDQANPSASLVTPYITAAGSNYGSPWGICFNSVGDLYVSYFGYYSTNFPSINKFDHGTLNRTDFFLPNSNNYNNGNTQLETDLEGNFYLGSFFEGVKKYNSTFSSYIELNEAGADRRGNFCFFINDDQKLFYSSNFSAYFKSVNLKSRLSGTPSASNVGTYPITLSATDGTTTATQFFNIIVSSLVPNAPTNVVATLNPTSVDIDFTPFANNGITSYTVNSSPAGLTGTGTSSPIRIQGPPDNTNFSFNTNYTFTVTATNAQGTGAASAASNAIVIVDTDGDGVPDSQELIDNTNQFEPCDYKPASQMRSNVSADWLAWDCDGDGRPNGVDTNPLNYAIGGIPGVIPAIGTRAYTNFFALADNDNDGIPNSMECFGTSAKCADFDGDGIANYQDTDSDGDGLLDATERNVDTDGDGDANYLDLDTDNDGILDRTELLFDTDNDGIPNLRDLDSDGDGIPDTNEATENFRSGVDLNTDGRLDDITDANGNGLADHLERKPLGIPDTDKDGVPDYLDLDSDGDGLVDRTEGGGDFDGDKIPNFRDMDSDNDWIADGIEGSADADNDGIPNYRDADSDGDGIVDSWEGADKCVSCTTLQDADNNGWDDRKQYAKDNKAIDTDKDGIPDFLDADSDNDTIEDRVELGADMDGDDIPNFRDTDSDNDKILDIIETAVDTDKDGMADFEDLDSDNDTLLDAIETDVDTDKDGVRDFRDEDSDGDKILDKNEKAIDTDADGKFNFQDTDSDGDGIPDAIETEVDTDKDGKQDYVDTESDGDGIPDAVEAGANPEKPLDTDKDGTANYLDLDSDNDGITDQSEAGKMPESPVDTDTDGTPDYLDLDSDNDKIDDKTETAIDTDKDGKPNYIDTDSDNDGITDLVETTIDTDKDNIPNYLDPDSDGDGIADKFEGTKDSDTDGRPDYLDLDSDNDGYSDADERGITSLDQAPLDTDKDGLADYIDTETDGDGILDKLEDDINLGNLPDCDKDGISNRLDKDICDLLKPRGISPNGDGKNDFLIIPGILRFEPNQLKIYNRWGNIVYETSNYQNNWAGTDNKGVELPDGVYWYLIDFFGKRPEISTYVYINRAD